MQTDLRSLVVVHNLVNVPEEMKERTNSVFTIHVTAQLLAPAAMKGKVNLPPLISSFNASHIQYVNNHYELKLNDGLEWVLPSLPDASSTYVLGMNVVVKESENKETKVIDTAPNIGNQYAFPIRIADVHRRKIITKVVGLHVGQIGVSFSVSPNDLSGYKERLKAFLSKHNPSMLGRVDEVVASVSEVETFTKLYKKYGVIKYEKRVTDFFTLYGPEHIDAVPETLKEWEKKEEDLIRNLVLDNGPEPEDIDARKRLVAFVEKYNLADLDVDALLKTHQNDYNELFTHLVAKHGPEPDPRSYLFPATYYQPPGATQVPMVSSAQPVVASQQPSFQESPPTDLVLHHQTSAYYNEAPTQVTASQPTRQSNVPQVNQLMAGSSQAANLQPVSSVQQPTSIAQSLMGRQSTGSEVMTRPGAASNIVELWSGFCADLRQRGIPPSELYYINEEAFSTLASELQYDSNSNMQLIYEWQRRVNAALHVEYYSPNDAATAAVRKEMIALSGLPALNISVVGVIGLHNPEHEAAFSLRLASAKVRSTERLCCTGEHNQLMSIAKQGFAPSATSAALSSLIFPMKPFIDVHVVTSMSILICDVVVGKPLVTVMDAPPATKEFHDSFDSCICHVSSDKQGTVVYSSQQVLPRYLVHVNIDPSLVPCPGHPTKPVEYYVVDNGTFACSQCVVMGPYQGKKVITVEEAATQAKSQLLEMTREASSLASEIGAKDHQLQTSIESMKSSVARQQAVKMAEEIRQEAERKATEILHGVDRQEQQQISKLSDERKQMISSKDEVNNVVKQLDEGVRSANNVQIIQLYMKAKEQNVVGHVKNRTQEGGNSTAWQTAGIDVSRSPTRVAEPAVTFDPLFAKFASLKDGRAPSHMAAFSEVGQSEKDSSKLFGGVSPRVAAFSQSTLQRLSQQRADFTNRPPPTSPSTSTYPIRPIQQDNTNHSIGRNSMASEQEQRLTRDQMKRGWTAYRSGDKQLAQQLWYEIYERNSHNAIGARARAYISEAVEKDYPNAALWYERALRIDPSDYMTLFNYGVLLESVMGKQREALTFFEAAHKLGDQTAGRRAELLRQQLHMQNQ